MSLPVQVAMVKHSSPFMDSTDCNDLGLHFIELEDVEPCIRKAILYKASLDVQAGFRKGRGTRDQIANICWIIEKARELKKKHQFLLY